MSELSNLIRQRIAGGKNVSQHPDADTITAYVEQCLSSIERENVTAHFAVCEPCREVLALSQPEIAEVQTVLRPAPVPAWRRLLSPKFGIAALVASMAIIAVLVLQLPHQADQSSQSQQAQTAASNQAAPTQTQQAPTATVPETPTSANQVPENETPENKTLDKRASATPLSAASNSSRTASQIQPSQLASRNAMAAPPPPPPARTPVLTAGLKKDYVNTDFFSSNGSDVVLGNQNANAVPSAPQPQTGKDAAVKPFDTSATRTTMFSDLPANSNGKPNLLIFTPPASTEHCKFCNKIATVTVHTFRSHLANPLRSSTIGSSTLGEPGMFSGTLQAGESVAVPAAPEKASDGDSLSTTSAFSSPAITGGRPILSRKSAVLWKVAGGKLIKSGTPSVWEDAYPAAGIQFSAVNARGNEVWAGGSDTSLIHSLDGGVTWEIVKLGADASGNIVGITADSTNVQVKTSEKQVWSSTDSGKTWSLQE